VKHPDALRRHYGRALYRKRNLHRSEDQAELFPLFMQGVFDEGSPTVGRPTCVLLSGSGKSSMTILLAEGRSPRGQVNRAAAEAGDIGSSY